MPDINTTSVRNDAASMKLFLDSVNILGAIHSEDINDVYDKLHEIAGLVNADLSVSEAEMFDRGKLKKTALELMEKEKLIEKDGSGYKIADFKETEYFDRIYKIKYDLKVTESARAFSELCLKISDTNAFSFLFKDDGKAENLLSALKDDIKDFNFGERTIKGIFTPAETLYKACLDADREVRGERAPEITRNMISDEMKERTSGIMPAGVISVMNALDAFGGYAIVMARKDFVFTAEEKIREKRGVLGFITKKIPKVETALKDILKGADERLKRVYDEKYEGKNRMNDAETKILEYNKTTFGYEERGDNFAKILSDTNVFRCGISEYIPGWGTALHMSKADACYGMLALMKYMKPGLNGVECDFEKPVTDVSKEAKRLKNLISAHKDLDDIYKEIKNKFISAHRGAVVEMTRMRKEASLEPLDYREHFNSLYNNPDKTEKPFRSVGMDIEEWKKADVEDIYKDNEAVVVYHKDGIITGLFKGENKGVTADRDENGRADGMQTFTTMRSHEKNEYKDYCTKSMLKDGHDLKASHMVQNISEDKQLAIYQKLKNYMDMGYEVRKNGDRDFIFKDPETGKIFTITKDTPVRPDEITVSEERFAASIRDVMKNKLLIDIVVDKETEMELNKALKMINSSEFLKNIKDPYIDDAKKLDELKTEINLTGSESVIDPEKREKIIVELKEKGILENTLNENRDRFYKRVNEIKHLIHTDPILAACRCIDRKFVREGDIVVCRYENADITVDKEGNVFTSGGNRDIYNIAADVTESMESVKEYLGERDFYTSDRNHSDPDIEK